MNRICVLKDVAYAAKVGGGVIASIKEINLLVPGALAIFNSNGVLLTVANAAANVSDIKDVTIASGRALDNQLINSVPRKIVDINRGNYRAFTKPVTTVGNLTIGASDEGEVYINVSDDSYTSSMPIRSMRASIYKKATTSISDAVDALVAKLNRAGSFVVAAKTGSTPNFNITLTPKEEGVTIKPAIGGLIEGDPITVSTAMVYGVGGGVDVLQLEKDFSVEEGNGNYVDYTAEWYKRNMEANTATEYDMINITWEGTHSSPTRSHNVMKNRIVIATDSTAEASTTVNQDTDNIMALLALVFGNVYVPATGAENATDDGTDQDGVSGN